MKRRALVVSVCRAPGAALAQKIAALAKQFDDVVVAVDDVDEPPAASLPARWHAARQATAGVDTAWCTALPLSPTLPTRLERVAALPVWLGTFDHVVVDNHDVAAILRVAAAAAPRPFTVELAPRLGENGLPPPPPPPMPRALVVTRAQPFHLGHLALIERALEVAAEVVVVVGAAERSHEPRDPFTAGERLALVRAGLGPLAARVWLLAVPTPSWPALALTTLWRLAPAVSCVVAHNRVLASMATEMGLTVHRLDTAVGVDGEPISGTAVRARLAIVDDTSTNTTAARLAWLQARVPDGVAAMLAAEPALGARLRALALPEHG